MKLTLFLLLLSFLVVSKSTYSQDVKNNFTIQDTLSSYSSNIWKQKTDTARLHANDIFFRKFQSVLQSPSRVSIPFDSIKGITRVISDDGILRIFTWNVPLSAGTNKYFGFIQLNQNGSVLIPIVSTENEVNDLSVASLQPSSWYGAIYYKIIPIEINHRKAYTLLGWDGYTAEANRKIIDILTFDEVGNALLGTPVFKTDKGIKSRIVHEYSEKANMLLRYDYQSVRVKKKKKIKKEDAWMIVMDRLIPMDPSMEGFRKFYVPAGDIYDGYIFQNGYWVLVEDIEAANK